MAILGLGLMGGSLGRALAAGGRGPLIRGWCPDGRDRLAASGSEAFSAVAATRSDALEGADLVVIATPLSACVELMPEVAAQAPPEATIIDLVSLKRPVQEAARAAGVGGRWVGCHPLAGSESSGFAASRADLYDGATVWTVAGPEAESRRGAVHRLWEGLGARPAPIEAVEHDRLMVAVSHLPQLASTALAAVLAELGVDALRLGPGGRDATRLAASSPEMWEDLLAAAPPDLVDAVRALAQECLRLADRLEEGDADAVAETLRRTRRWKRGG